MQRLPGLAGRYPFAIFVLAFATLSYQVLITRFFSVVLYYHFAFAAISLAMLGLTHGAVAVYKNPERYAPDRVDVEFARHAWRFAVSGVGAMVTFLCLPLVVPGDYLIGALALAALAFVIPFGESGVCITLLLTRLPHGGGRLYAADLTGAALGCLGIIFALLVVDPVSATFWIGAFAAGAGWVVTRRSVDGRNRRLSGAVALALAAAAFVHTGLDAAGQSHLGVFWAKGQEQANTLFERWNTYSRVRVTPNKDNVPFGWGFARAPETTIEQKYLDIDADAATVISRFDGDLAKLSFLKNDVINSAYLIQPPTDVAIIGVGGGRDILSGLLFGAKKISGIEINPAIFEVLTDKFADFSGHLDRQPGVTLTNAEARSYINHSSDRYDLVQISLIDTWAATVAGGLTLTENRLYTVDAWSDFYRALKPGGLLSVSRWFGLDGYRGEFHRLIAIAVKALERQGVPATELARHVIALNVGSIVTVITRPDAFTDAQWTGARGRLEAQGFKIILGPGIVFDDITSTLMSGKADPAYFASLPSNIAASTDDNPFFFFTQRFSQLLVHPWAAITENNAPVSMTLLLLFVALGACFYYIVLPFVRLARRMPLAQLTPPVAYFSAIGMAFMLIEISQMQRLMVFLGHPVYGLGVVLFTILICSGIGSATVGALAPRPGAVAGRLAALLATLVLTGVLTPLVTAWTRTEATDIRILVSALLLAPPAFCMGMMFPLGLNSWRRHADLLPFFWSANGITSMLASVLGMALSIEYGIANTYAIGVSFYVVSGAMLIMDRQASATTAMAVSSPNLMRQGDGALDPVAPSIQATENELIRGASTAASLEPTP